MALPYSRRSEMLVLGTMLTKTSELETAVKALDESSFYCQEHQLIFNTLKSLHKQGTSGNVFIVTDELKKQNKLVTIGVSDYLEMLTQYCDAFDDTEEHIQDLKKYAQLRQLILVAQEAIELTFDLIEIMAKSETKMDFDLFKKLFFTSEHKTTSS